MFNEKELECLCPYCFQQITFLVEELYGNQTYIEDCEVCCQPIQISFVAENGEVTSFHVEKAD